jgi:hypothetical protein
MADQAKKERDSYMLVKGACPLSIVLKMRAAEWTMRPVNAKVYPDLARVSFFEKRKAK